MTDHTPTEYRGLIDRYWKRFPMNDRGSVITLLEGNTPLVRAKKLADAVAPGVELYLKYDGLNPTCSFKDRGMTLAVSKAVEEGSQAVICASTGNTSASAAAYAAKAGIRAYVLIPQGKIALGKLSQAVMHGATVIQVEGNFDEALMLVREISETHPITMVNSLNEFRIIGQKSAAFEIIDVLGDAPDYHALPVGNAGNITSYWMGYTEYFKDGIASRRPKMIGFQAAGAAPIVRGEVVTNPETIATAIRIGNPASWKRAELARDESGGLIDMVTDEEILEAYRIIAATEGIFCEPASAASVAGVKKAAGRGMFKKGERIVCTLTGHGLKDPDTAIGVSPETHTVKPKMDDVLSVMDFT
ncbi:MAG: threonine synthase [Deltaproteobacteria bacterium]|nr:threonine synthase [Candidatus Zymogenaceae bacterium]